MTKESVNEVRVAGITHHPNGREEYLLEPVRDAKGIGRWIYCKYCHKNVKPMLSGINQIVCSKCGCGLTPDFFVFNNLKRWLSGDSSALDEDRNSPEARIWLEEVKTGKSKSWRIMRP